MPKPSFNPGVDTYIDNAKPFAVPILLHLRKLIHCGCPGVEESIKWSRPFFEYKGVILCNFSAFSKHCSVGFWGEEITAVLREADALKPEAMGSLGRITSRKDLPPDDQLLDWIRQAAAFIESGNHTSPIAARHRVAKAPKAALATPDDLTAALQGLKAASKVFAEFSPSCRREYIEWITSAKRTETRAKRVAATIQQLTEGKHLNWRYQTSGATQSQPPRAPAHPV